MNNYLWRINDLGKGVVHKVRKVPKWKILAYLGAGFIGLAVIAVFVLFVYGNSILNGYGKARLERSFAQAFPGNVLKIGKLDYSRATNLLVADSVRVSATSSTYRIGRVELKDVHWMRLIWGSAGAMDAFAKARLDATNLDAEFHQAKYTIHCQRVHASVPESTMTLFITEIHPTVDDEELFAADAYRMTRFRVVLPECAIAGLDYDELFLGESYSARSIRVYRPTFDALADRYKSVGPFVKSPLMVHEALAAIRKPLRIDTLSITDGDVKYSERAVRTDIPGVLTFTEFNLDAVNLANRRDASVANQGEAAAVIRIYGHSKLMDAGVLSVEMEIPVASPDFSYHYFGSLTAMDLTRLNKFLDYAEHTRIKSGQAQMAEFDINVDKGVARGHVHAIFKNLKIAFLDNKSRSENGLGDLITSFLANLISIKSSNSKTSASDMKVGKVAYTKQPDEAFFQFSWFALRSGVLDVIHH